MADPEEGTVWPPVPAGGWPALKDEGRVPPPTPAYEPASQPGGFDEGAFREIKRTARGIPAVGQPPDPYAEALAARKEQERVAREAAERMKGRTEQYTDIASQPTPRPPQPQFQNIPDAPQTMARSMLKEWMPSGVFMLMMGIGMAKGNMMNAMKAGTGLLEGYQEGDKAKIDREREIWKDQTEVAVKKNDIALKQYDAIVKDIHLGQVDKQAKLTALMAANKDDALRATMVSHGMDGVAKFNEDRIKANEGLEKTLAKLDTERREVDLKLKELKIDADKLKLAKATEQEKLGGYKHTAEQSKNLMFATMMERGNRNMDKLKAEKYEPTWAELTTMDKIWAMSKTSPAAANQLFAALTDPAQRYYQAAAEFVAGVLRKETGAAFNAGELVNELQRYTAGPWDTPGVAKQKEESRRGMESAVWAGTGLPGDSWSLEKVQKLMGAPVTSPAATAKTETEPPRPADLPAAAKYNPIKGGWEYPDETSPTKWRLRKSQ